MTGKGKASKGSLPLLGEWWAKRIFQSFSWSWW